MASPERQAETSVTTAGGDVAHCHVDIETFSKVNLKKTGVYSYAEDPSTEILVVCYKFGHDGPVNVWIPMEPDDFPEEARPKVDDDAVLYVQPHCPDDIEEWAVLGGEFRAWNAMFERVVLRGPAGKRIGFPQVPAKQWFCTMAKAAAHSLPQALERAADACGTHPKDKTGGAVMLQLAKPRKPSKKDKSERWTIDTHPLKYKLLYEYCEDDVRAESDLDRYIPELSPNEKRAYHLDQLINDRGVSIDLDKVADVQVLIDDYKGRLNEQCQNWTGVRATQRDKLVDWIREDAFYPIENMQVPTILEAVQDPGCPDHVKRVLRLYSTHNMKAVTKYSAMERAVCADARLRGMFAYHAASTGRWASRIVQLQNLYRPNKKVDPDLAIDMFQFRDLDYFKDFWEVNPMVAFASCVRGMLVPGPEKLLLCIDFSAIEARVVAWLAGQDDILQVFRDGKDVYVFTAAKIFRVSIEEVDDERRFIGKIAVLALGYQGGKKAFAKMAKQYGVDIDEDFADDIKVDWRAANTKIVNLWYDLEEAACAAIANPGNIYKAARGLLMFKVVGDWLYMRLPSGRRLAYYKPRLDSEGKPTYLGVDTYTRLWTRCKTYGGKLVENATQAVARDLLLFSMFNLEDAGYPLIGTVHDEVMMEIDECPEALWQSQLDAASEIMCRIPKWAGDLPVAAEGFVARRYRK